MITQTGTGTTQRADGDAETHSFYGARGLDIVRGEGVWVFDGHGRRYLDATSMYGTASLGHAHPAVTAAVAGQAERLMSCYAGFGNDVRAECLKELARLCAPLDRAFLCNSGTEAVEAALKVARFATGRAGILATTGGFHGRTFGALSATFRADHRRTFEPLVPGFRHVRFNSTTDLDARLDDSIAAFLVEPIQGEGGVHPAADDYLRTAARLARERGALLIVDEVQTGFARTGDWFGFRAAGIEPDLVCLAKGMAGGMPMGALAIGPRVGDLAKLSHGSTFGGNPLACAAARATLRTMRELELPTRVAARSARLLVRLKALAVRSDRVREVRGRGLLLGIELKERVTPTLRALQERGVLALSAGPTVLRLLPPLTISESEVDALAESVEEVLA